MLKHISVFFLLLMFALCCHAQEVLSGVVVDDNGGPLPSIVVKLYDGVSMTMLNYVITDEKGHYSIEVKGKSNSLLLRYTAMGFRQEEHRVGKLGDQGRIVLKEEETELREVSVRAKPVTTHGDTINYNVARLKEKNDRNIEDVIKKIPGVEIEGSVIKYNGKPINKFYIEGVDMLGGRYNLASKNIDADDIVTVSVYENHQPKRALKDIVLSDQAALDLKLREQRMLKPIGNVKAGIGYGDEALWMAESFTLMVAPQKQFLVAGKANNVAQFYTEETADNFSEATELRPLVAGKLQPVLTGTSYVPATRTRTNRSGSCTYNSAHRLAQDAHLTVNAGYNYCRMGIRQDKRTIYWLSDDKDVVVDENSQSRADIHQGWMSVAFESNKNTHYVKEHLKMEGELSGYKDCLTGNSPITQKIASGNYLLTNNIETVWRKGNSAFNLLSTTTFGSTPRNRLTTMNPTTNDSLLISQDIEGLKFHTQESSSYSWVLSRVATFALNASFTADYDCMDAHLKRSVEDERMRYGGYTLKTEVTPTISLSAGNVGATLGLVGELDNLHYKNLLDGMRYDYDKPQAGVRVSFSYKMRQMLRMSLGASYMRSLGNMLDYITQSVYTTYRDRRELGTGLLNMRDKTSANIGLNYRNVLNGVNASAMVTYQYIHGNVTSGSVVTAQQTQNIHEASGNNAVQWIGAARLSRNLYDCHTVLSLTGDVFVNRQELLRQSRFCKISNNIYSVEGSVRSSVFRRYALLDFSVRYTLSTQHLSLSDGITRNNDFSLNGGVTVFPCTNLGVYVRANSTFVQVPAATGTCYSRCMYLDAGTQYSFGKFEVELSAHNLTNRKQYHLRQFTSCDIYDYIYYLRPLEATVSIKYNF